MNSPHSFLLAYFSSTSYGHGIFYEVYSTSSLAIDYDLWTCSKQIPIPKQSLHQHDSQFPYDFQFQRVQQESNDYHQFTVSSPNTNGSLFGIPRLPPKQSTHQSPSWDTVVASPITTPKRALRPSIPSPKPSQLSSPTSVATVPSDSHWKEAFLQRMESYEAQIQCLSALVRQLLANRHSFPSTPVKESLKRDVAIQSEPTSPSFDEDSASGIENNQTAFMINSMDQVRLSNI